ncbi:unnamed protein product [Gongylonema pulchrum]|uniref:OCRE domain-containing protein n=1 Tax=Gongylonema pulchrum TaxID=637853 RepID=A0A183CX66_9BILA|nr:unnamed protein product [Gongylonema pulchrum]
MAELKHKTPEIAYEKEKASEHQNEKDECSKLTTHDTACEKKPESKQQIAKSECAAAPVLTEKTYQESRDSVTAEVNGEMSYETATYPNYWGNGDDEAGSYYQFDAKKYMDSLTDKYAGELYLLCYAAALVQLLQCLA